MLESLTAIAVLGTARQGDAALPSGGEVGAFCAALSTDSAEGRLLSAAGVLATAALAGARPAAATGVVEAEAVAPQRTRGVQAAAQLRRVLASGYWPLLADWSRTTQQHGCHAPEEMLPALLTALRARLHEPAVASVLAVLGPRGRWLAGQNPSWALLLADFDAVVAGWEVATGVERSRLFAILRRLDAARARDALESVLPAEDAEMRAALVAALRVGLTDADEPLLEATLDDGSKVVRREAAELLARLPTSRRGVRMAERARDLVQVTQRRGLLRTTRTTVSITLPESSKELTRDGIEDKKLDDLGNRAWMLAQLVAAAPLSTWQTEAELDPVAWLAACRNDEWYVALRLGWTIAAARQANAEWAAALLEDLLAEAPGTALGTYSDWLPTLVTALPPETREKLLRKPLAAAADGLTRAPLWDALLACEHAWSADFSRRVLTALAGYVAALASSWDARLRPECAAALAVRADLPTAAEVVGGMTAAGPYASATQRWVDELAGLVQLRREYA